MSRVFFPCCAYFGRKRWTILEVVRPDRGIRYLSKQPSTCEIFVNPPFTYLGQDRHAAGDAQVSDPAHGFLGFYDCRLRRQLDF